MTINNISPDNPSLNQIRPPLSGAGAADQISLKQTSAQHVASQGKDGSDVSSLSRLMAKAAKDIEKDAEIRPEKVAMARTLIEKGDPLSDRDIDATWDKMLPHV